MTNRTKFFIGLLAILISTACSFVEKLVLFESERFLVEQIYDPLINSCNGDECLSPCMLRLHQVVEERPTTTLQEPFKDYNYAVFDLMIYEVNGDEITNPKKYWAPEEFVVYQNNTTEHKRIWDFYVAIIPENQRKIVKKFVIFTNGPEDLRASVERNKDKPDDWKIGFDILDFEHPFSIVEILIHETGHLITLKTSQIPYDKTNEFSGKQDNLQCSNYFTAEGCSLPDSYINLFYQQFWTDLYEEWWNMDQEAQTRTYKKSLEIRENFYLEHQFEFLNPYAVTNLKEDIAVAWTYFILQPKPIGNGIVDQKVLFFYEYPELIELRDELINNICTYTHP